jgi:hypothetical protein
MKSIRLWLCVGLDPAQLLFEGFKKEVQLDADDALFVEVMHTDAKPTVPLLGAGILRAVGKLNHHAEIISLFIIQWKQLVKSSSYWNIKR